MFFGWVYGGGSIARTPFLFSLGLLMACVTTMSPTPDTQPGDMSAAQHRREAEQHEGAARAAEMYGTSAVAPQGSASNEWGAVGRDRTQESVGLSQEQQAFEHRIHAQQHREAAALLEMFEDAECKMVAAPTRSDCPLLNSVAEIEEIPQGVRIHLREGADVGEVLQRMRCHHAFGKAQGFENMGTCPLYLDRIEMSRTPDGYIDITSDWTALVTEIRNRIRTHVQFPAESHP